MSNDDFLTIEAHDRFRGKNNPLLDPASDVRTGLAPPAGLITQPPLEVAMGEASPERVAQVRRDLERVAQGKSPLSRRRGP